MQCELNNNDKHDNWELLRRFAKPLLVVVFIIFLIELYIINSDTQKVPTVAKGDVAVFNEEFSKHAQISKIEANENCIFILYSKMNAIAIYDMNGVYQQSFAFPNIPNAVLNMRYDNGLLYVQEARYLYIFDNCRLLYSYEQTDSLFQPLEWYLKSGDISITISDRSIYNLDGEYIMSLPGKL